VDRSRLALVAAAATKPRHKNHLPAHHLIKLKHKARDSRFQVLTKRFTLNIPYKPIQALNKIGNETLASQDKPVEWMTSQQVVMLSSASVRHESGNTGISSHRTKLTLDLFISINLWQWHPMYAPFMVRMES
jgi:hypothetical protein